MSGNSTFSVIIAIAVGLMVICLVPLVTLEERVDNVTQQDVQKIVENVVNESSNTGTLTRAQYQDLENKLAANPGKKVAQANYTKIGENLYVGYYTTQVLSQIGIKTGSETVSTTNDTITFKPGDIISISAKSSDSAAKDLKSNLFSFVNSGEEVVSASASAMITVHGSK